VFLSSL
jgi:hypothetical protein